MQFSIPKINGQAVGGLVTMQQQQPALQSETVLRTQKKMHHCRRRVQFAKVDEVHEIESLQEFRSDIWWRRDELARFQFEVRSMMQMLASFQKGRRTLVTQQQQTQHPVAVVPTMRYSQEFCKPALSAMVPQITAQIIPASSPPSSTMNNKSLTILPATCTKTNKRKPLPTIKPVAFERSLPLKKRIKFSVVC